MENYVFADDVSDDYLTELYQRQTGQPQMRSPVSAASDYDAMQDFEKKWSSEAQAQAVQQDDLRNEDPALSWFRYGMMNPEVEEYQRATGAFDGFDREFATQFSKRQPKNLEDYIQLSNEFIQRQPYMADYIKKRADEMMPPNIKADYEARRQKAARTKAMMEEFEMNDLRDQYFSKRFGGDYVVGPDGKPMPAWKAQSDKRKSKKDIYDTILKLRAGITAVDKKTGDPLASPEQIEMDKRMIQELYSDLSHMGDGGYGAPVQPKSKAEYDALPSGTIFIDPNGVRRRKP